MMPPLRQTTTCAFALLLLLLACGPTTAQRARRLQFPPGRTAVSVTGTLTRRGDESHIYLLRARAGQTLTARISARGRGDAVFSIRAPSGAHVDEDNPIETNWSGEVPQSGDYRIRIFNPSAHIRGLTRYTLEISAR